MTSTEIPISIDAAAKQIGINRRRLREICIKSGVAIRWGGTDSHPFLKVLFSDVRRVVLNQRYQPPAQPGQKRRASRPMATAMSHPDVHF